MAGIAAAADISAGLIYRYFASKNEIILAIIERQLELSQGVIAELDGSIDIALDIWKILFEPEGRPDKIQPALHMEMSAEASRNPQIARAVACSDKEIRSSFTEWLGRARDMNGLGLPAERATMAGLLLPCLVDGLRIRLLREPDLDPAMVQRALRDLIEMWLRR